MSLMELTTEVAPTQKFTVDGAEYDLRGPDHLSDDEDAKLTAMFARHDKLSGSLSEAKNDETATSLAKKLADKRVDIIVILTTMPRDEAKKLPLKAQQKLFRAIRNELSGDTDPDEGEDAESPGDDEEG